MNPWLVLTAAIILEVVGSTALKASEGFTRLLPSLLMLGAYALTFFLVSRIVLRLPLATVYAIWAGAGTALTALGGVIVFGESLSFLQALGIGGIVAGIVYLNRSGITAH